MPTVAGCHLIQDRVPRLDLIFEVGAGGTGIGLEGGVKLADKDNRVSNWSTPN